MTKQEKLQKILNYLYAYRATLGNDDSKHRKEKEDLLHSMLDIDEMMDEDDDITFIEVKRKIKNKKKFINLLSIEDVKITTTKADGSIEILIEDL